MYTRASPGLLGVTPDLEKEVDTGPYQHIDLAGDSSTASTTTTVRTPKAGKDFPGGSTDTSTDTLLDASMDVSSKTPLDHSTDVSSLRVGFVSKFFGDEASVHVGSTWASEAARMLGVEMTLQRAALLLLCMADEGFQLGLRRYVLICI